MVTRQLGFRRLYAAIGYVLENEFPFFRIQFGDFETHIYFGPRPKLSAVFFPRHPYLTNSGPTILFEPGHEAEDAMHLSSDSLFWIDIICWKEIEVDESILNDYQALALLAQQHEAPLITAVDALAGTIGIIAFPKLIAHPAVENFILREGHTPDTGFVIDYADLLIPPTPRLISRTSLEEIAKRLWSIGKSDRNVLEEALVPLGWLVRGWNQHSSVFEFVALFVALEVVVNTYDPTEDQEQRKKADHLANQIKRLIRKHGGPEKKALQQYFGELRTNARPTLVSKFITMAQKAKMPGWERDVEAFSRFNQIRNDIVHRGAQHISFFVEVSSKEVRELEELVRRYVRWSLQDRSITSSS